VRRIIDPMPLVLRSLWVATLLLAGCSSGWNGTYIKQNPANPLRGSPQVCFGPPVFVGARIEGERIDDFKAALAPDKAAAFAEELAGFVGNYFQLLDAEVEKSGRLAPAKRAPAAGPGIFTVQITVALLTRGSREEAAEIGYRVDVRDPGGQIVESYRNSQAMRAGVNSVDRLKRLGAMVLDDVATYVQARAAGRDRP